MAIAKQFLQASPARKEKDPSSSIIDMEINFLALDCTVFHWPAQSTMRLVASVVMEGRWNGGKRMRRDRGRGMGITFSSDIVADPYMLLSLCSRGLDDEGPVFISVCQPTILWMTHAGNILSLSLAFIPLSFLFSSPLFLLNNFTICLWDWRSHSGPVSGETSLVLTVCVFPIKTRGPPQQARHAALAAILAQVMATPPGAILAPFTVVSPEHPNIGTQIQRSGILLLSALHRLAEGSLQGQWHQVIGGGEPSWLLTLWLNLWPFWNLFWKQNGISMLNSTNLKDSQCVCVCVNSGLVLLRKGR